ncbi:hypothetical protein HELRODRAFT_172739 [Helobdella robusta]|uniref:Uncharacterized protein n=1 Tax=Helobdella robusta TaxID=6412 RepID=T1F5W3_HELRO|nr:hypothetical protein HELRODRAFT_172739 [Helobdella robusta]ESO04373.1 hypothetical protein HELRODRAFT_172739 [Helobdella robusta]
MADELCNDEALTSVENMYQVTMLEIIDRVITELSVRFESLNNVNKKRPRMKRKMADELCNDEALTSVENMYQVTMLEIIDRVITELSVRFESLNNVNSMFGFLSGVKIEEMQI